jgi:hypothetical protein
VTQPELTLLLAAGHKAEDFGIPFYVAIGGFGLPLIVPQVSHFDGLRQSVAGRSAREVDVGFALSPCQGIDGINHGLGKSGHGQPMQRPALSFFDNVVKQSDRLLFRSSEGRGDTLEMINKWTANLVRLSSVGLTGDPTGQIQEIIHIHLTTDINRRGNNRLAVWFRGRASLYPG